MHMQSSDEIEVEQAIAGDRAAFARLIARHYDLIFRVAFRLLGTQADAEDLAQDICIELPAKLKSFKGQSKFSTWLYQVVMNKARDSLRKRATHAKAASGWGEREVLLKAEHVETNEAIDWLYTAMSGLSEDLRETVALVLGEELNHTQAGEVLGVSEGTIGWRMSEVRKALKEQAKAEDMLQ